MAAAIENPRPAESRRTLRKHITSRMLTGLLTLIPFAATVLILRFMFRAVASLLRPMSGPVERLGMPDFAVFLLSCIIIAAVLYLAGVIVTNSLGKRGLAMTETLFMKLPLLRTVYGSIRSTVQTLSRAQRKSFRSVVILEFPRRGAWCVGFVTGHSTDGRGEEYVRLFIPTTPNPTSGYFAILRKGEVIQTQMSVEEGIQSVVSGGILFPDRFDSSVGTAGNASQSLQNIGENPDSEGMAGR